MSINITPFSFEGFAVRTIQIDGEPWFVAADVCDSLTVATGQTRRLDEDEKGLRTVQTLGGPQDMLVINESGLYSLILTSRKPEAKRFKKWVTREVLPAIRKTGSYSIQPQALPNFSNPAEAARAWALEYEARIEAEKQLALAAPKVEFVDRYVEATGLFTFREVAKLLKANEARFREFLLGEKVMYRLGAGGALTAYQNHVDAGRFEFKTGVAENDHSYRRSMFTSKGVFWVRERWREAQQQAQGQEVAA